MYSLKAVRSLVLTIVILLCLAGFVIYLPTLSFGFVHDDHAQVAANSQIQSWRNAGRLLVTDVWSQKGEGHVGTYYRPVFTLWLLLVRTLCGLNTWEWHLSSILLYAGMGLITFLFSVVVLDSRAAGIFISLLFAVHPIHIESVSWISAANELLYSGFFLGSFLLFNRFLNPNCAKRRDLLLSVLLWTAALLSKETAVALLPVFFLWAYLRADEKMRFWQKLAHVVGNGGPFILACGFYLGTRALVLQRFGTELARHSWSEILLTSADLVRFYVLKILFPVHLSPFYGTFVIATPSIKFWATALFGLAIITLTVWIGLRREPLVALATSLFVLPLIPVLIGVRIFRDGDLAHDRYLYLPSVGFCILVGLLFRYFWTKASNYRWLVGSIAGITLIALLGLNVAQQRYYHDDEAFYKRGLEVAPNNTLVAGFLGSYYFRQGKFDLGVQQFRHAYEVSPQSPDVAYRFARALFEAGKFDEAEPLLGKLSDAATTPEPRRAVLKVALGQTQIRLNKLPAAQMTLEPLLATNDSLRELHRTLAGC